MNFKEDNLIPGLRIWAFMLSALVHILVFSNVLALYQYKAPTEQEYIEIDLVQKPVIVSESAASEKKSDTNHLSSKDTATQKEQIKKGITQKLPAQAQKQMSQKQNQKLMQKSSAENKEQVKFAKNLDTAKLLLTDKELNKFSSANFQQKSIVSDSQRSQTLNSSYQPFRQNRLFEKFGTPDYLPDVKEGEVTLLNAKADQHAVFVRRVAIQVFSALRAKNWAQVGFAQARQTKRFATIEAIMNREGKLISLRLTDSSGSKGFDLVLEEAVKIGVWDQNPQMSAALEDGNIYFIFQAKTWAEIIGDPGRERRWLLLATGLK